MPFGGKLNENNRWLKMEELIPWEELEEEYAKIFSQMGRPAKDAQLVIGAICIKHKEGLSDEGVRDAILENPYMQAFCGLENFVTKKEQLFNGSSLSRVRKRMGKKYFRKFERKVLNKLKGKRLIKGRVQMLDATVFPSNIRYPTDVWLLNQVREWLVKRISQIGKKVGKLKRTYKRKAREKYLNFSKKRKRRGKTARGAQKQMIQYVRRNLRQLEELIEEIGKRGMEIEETIKNKLKVAKKIYKQQVEMYRERKHRVKDRIVSFHQPDVRPMIRGKAGKDVEFGPKGELSLVDGYLFLDKIDFNNFNEAKELKDSVEKHKERFGYKPKELIADNIFGTLENREYLRKGQIKAALKPLGRRAQSTEGKRHRNWVKRKQKERNQIEGKIGCGKEYYGLDKIKYKIKDGAEIWVRMGLLAMNLDTALKRA